MARSATIVRIVVNGRPSKEGYTNFDKARLMLSQALKSDLWPSERCVFVIMPGGFIQGRMPAKYSGNRGWNSRPQDFQSLIPVAQAALDKVVTDKMKREFALRARFLTLGVDLMLPGQTKGTVATGEIGTHAELVAVIDLSTGLCKWTGKSYPMGRQENKLVHETDLKSHCCLSEPRTLILGCHDLNAWSERARANAKSFRKSRWKELDKLARQFEPAFVLHHPHQTDEPMTWCHGWSGIRQHLDSVRAYASAIAYCHRPQDGNPRKPLDSVLESTKYGAVADVHVDGYRH